MHRPARERVAARAEREQLPRLAQPAQARPALAVARDELGELTCRVLVERPVHEVLGLLDHVVQVRRVLLALLAVWPLGGQPRDELYRRRLPDDPHVLAVLLQRQRVQRGQRVQEQRRARHLELLLQLGQRIEGPRVAPAIEARQPHADGQGRAVGESVHVMAAQPVLERLELVLERGLERRAVLRRRRASGGRLLHRVGQLPDDGALRSEQLVDPPHAGADAVEAARRRLRHAHHRGRPRRLGRHGGRRRRHGRLRAKLGAASLARNPVMEALVRGQTTVRVSRRLLQLRNAAPSSYVALQRSSSAYAVGAFFFLCSIGGVRACVRRASDSVPRAVG